LFGWLRRDRYASLRRSPDLVTAARAEAADNGHEYVGTDHLLLALCRRTDSTTWRAVAAFSVSPWQVRAAVRRDVLPGLGEVSPEDMPLSPAADRAVQAAAEYARRLGHLAASEGHVLIALLADPESIAHAVLVGLGVNPRQLALAVARASGWPPPVILPAEHPSGGGPAVE
jgi:ATP-dependent Clp protease ATP-binding subunit ClpC